MELGVVCFDPCQNAQHRYNTGEDRDADNPSSVIAPLLSPGRYSTMCISGKMFPLEKRKYKLVGESHLRPVCLMPSWLGAMLYPLVLR